jgi:phosphoserine phosphatase SerB
VSTDHRFLVVLDVDSTLINEEGLDEIARAVDEETGARIAAVTERAMRGEIDFVQSLTERVALLAGVSEDVLTEAASSLSITPGAHELVSAVQEAGGKVCAVSGGFHELVDPLAREVGLDDWRANRFVIESGRLTGRINGAVVDGAAKKDALAQWATQWGFQTPHTVAIGDGANDIPMLQSAGVSVGFCAKPAVQAVVDHTITERDLSQVLTLLGMTRG